MLEAPDGFRWSVGKELVLSSGYVIAQDPDCIRRSFEDGGARNSAAFMLKRERYLPQIPQDMIDLFDHYEVPLISMPFSIPWMEVMSQINVAVMNRTVRRFRIQRSDAIQAYFIVMESRELLDFYDEYAIRIAFLSLQGLYEQVMVAQNVGNIGFENFILYALNSHEDDREKLMAQASVQGISMSTKYV